MIKVSNQVPQAYTDESRDFQLLEHLFDAVANGSRAGIDGMRQQNGMHEDSRLLRLSACTLGFSPRHAYSDRDLLYLCETFKDIVRKKGSKTAIDYAVNMLMRAQNIRGDHSVDVVNCSTDGSIVYKITVSVPSELTDVSMLDDLFDYILPAGYVYSINRHATSGTSASIVIPISVSVSESSGTDEEKSDMSSKLSSVPTPSSSAAEVDAGDINISTVVGSVKSK